MSNYLNLIFFRVLCQYVALPAHSKIKSMHHYAWPEPHLFFVTEIISHQYCSGYISLSVFLLLLFKKEILNEGKFVFLLVSPS